MRLKTDANGVPIQNINSAYLHCDTLTGTPNYYGFMAVDGSYLVKQVSDTATRYSTGRGTYVSGSGFGAWAAGLTYGLPSEAF